MQPMIENEEDELIQSKFTVEVLHAIARDEMDMDAGCCLANEQVSEYLAERQEPWIRSL